MSHDQSVGAPKPKLSEAQHKRLTQTGKAIIYSVLATLAIVLVFLALNPQAEHEYDPGVDVEQTASEIVGSAKFTPLAPNVPDSWQPNYARWHNGAVDDIPYWEAGYLTDDDEFFGFAQTAHPTQGWITQITAKGHSEGTVDIGGTTFEEFTGEDGHRYLVGEVTDPAAEGPVTLVVQGSLPAEELDTLTAEILRDLEELENA